MSVKLFVGSLAYTVTDEELSTLFAEAGTVVSAKVIMDRDTNQSKGFGFVEFESEDEAQKAISIFGGQEHNGRRLTVNKAKPMTPRTGGAGGGGGQGGGGQGGFTPRNRY